MAKSKEPRMFTSEADVKTELMNLLEKDGYWIRMVASPFVKAGIPDIIGTYRGMFLGIEVKMGVKRKHNRYVIPVRFTKIQRLNLYSICEAGGAGILFVYLHDAPPLVEEYDRIIIYFGDVYGFVDYVKQYVDEIKDNLHVDKPIRKGKELW